MPSRTDMRLFGLEYKTVFVGKEAEDLCIEGYQVFGWSLLEISQPPPGNAEYLLTFCRNRTSEESPDMIRLGKRFDSCIRQINSLEKIKLYAARYAAITTGLFGMGMIFIGILIYPLGWHKVEFALFSVSVCLLIAPRFIYRRLQRVKEFEINPLIKRKKDESKEVIVHIQWIHENNR